MKIYRSREGALTDDDVKTQLSTLGSQTAPGPLLVPGAATFLRAIHVAPVSSNEAAGDYGFMIRLEGPGIQRGVFNVAAGAGGTAVATGGHVLTRSTRIPVNIPVTPNQEILAFAEALGTDMGTYQVGVTLEFGDAAGDEGESKGEVTVEGQITAVDTKTSLVTQGSVTTPSRLTPPDATKLQRIVAAIGADCAADGEVSYLLRLSGDAIRGGEQTIFIAAESFIDVQSGADPAVGHMPPVILDMLDIDIAPNETLDIDIEMCGVDVGTATAVVTAVFQ